MIEQTNTRPSGLNSQAIRTWGMLFLLLGIAGRSIIQNGLLGLQNVTTQQLLEAMQQSSSYMGIVTLALVLMVVEACAVPLFAFLLVEGSVRTRNLNLYMLRVLGLAIVSEVPYNLAMTGKLLDLSGRNPVFGLVLCLIMLHFFRRYPGKKAANVAIKAAVMVAAIAWSLILSIDQGPCTVILVATLWAVWTKGSVRTFAGCIAAVVCTLFSPYFLGAPMTFLVLHFYNGEKGEGSTLVNYLCYPAMLLVIGLTTAYLF